MATCPICKSDVEEIKSGFIHGKTFHCAKHGEFQVSDRVLNVPASWMQLRANGRPHLKMLPGGQPQDCAHESSHMTSSFPRRHNH
jgi:hypothetical protein